MVTSYTRAIVVLSFLRTALGTQTTPPNIVLISLALFLTMFIMQPTFDKAWESGVRPLMNNQIDEETAFGRTMEPIQDFMLKHTRPKDLNLFAEISKANDAAAAATKASSPEKATPPAAPKKDVVPKAGEAKADVSLRSLIPAFMISELRRAFEIGFLLFLPFLIIDMVVASILMSMGMMMLPPSIISLPFKIIFFVLVDGWYLVCGSLIQSYGGG
jgi:flagellar biosynthesis protein FliP